MSTFVKKYDEYLDETYYYMKHSSGLDIYVMPKELATSYAMITVKYGSFDNRFAPKGKPMAEMPEGIAHFLEHKLFDNQDGSDTFEKFAEMGAFCNAYTSFDRTAYLFSSTEGHRECLGLLLDFVFSPYFTEESVKKEQGIIAEEIKMGLDSPYNRCFHLLTRLLYTDHPVCREIAGSEESVMQINRDMLYSCYNTFYAPFNMVLTVSGDFDCNEVLTLCNKKLPRLQHKEFTRGEKAEPRSVREKRGEESAAVSKPIFCVGFKDDGIEKRGRTAMRRALAADMLCDLLFGQTSTFYGKMLETGLADRISASYLSCRSVGFAYVNGTSEDPETVYGHIMESVREMKHSGIDRAAFSRIKKAMISDMVRSFNSTEEICELVADCALTGCDVFDYGEVLRSIGVEELEFLLCELFDERFAAMAVVNKNGEGAPSSENEEEE